MCLIIILIAVLYGMGKGLISMLKPIISLVIARALSGAVRAYMSSSNIPDVLLKYAYERSSIPKDYKLVQMGYELVSESIISVISFLLTYIMIRVILSIIFSALGICKRGAIYKIDRFAGAAISLVVVCFFIYYLTIGSTALANLGFTSVANLSNGLNDSIIPNKIVFIMGSLLHDVILS